MGSSASDKNAAFNTFLLIYWLGGVFASSLERDRVPLARPVASKEVPLVDRTEEMKLLKEAVDRTVQGEGGVVFLHGEAGIGKTRLTRELRAYAHLKGMQVLYGRCPGLFRMDGVPPYIIWKEAIKDYLETCTFEQLYRVIGYYPAEVAKLVPELGQKLRVMPPSFPISPEQEQNRLFEAVSQFMTNLSREAPLLLILDDLQWMDPSSLLLMHYLASGLQKMPLLLIGAYRSTDIDAKHPLTPILAELKRESLPKSVSLKRMSPEDTREIIRQILEQEEIPIEFCNLVYEKTRGNPFFTMEVLESLKEEDVIFSEGNKWKIKEVSKIEFPETVKSVVTSRIRRLDEECQNALTMASFVGNDFTLEALCAVTGMEKSKLLTLMDRLFKTGLIKETVIRGEGICSFADVLVRDVAYEEVSPLTRKELHGVVACALEKVYATKIDEHLGELASHFLESGDNDKALDYFLKAGEKAQRIHANDEAAFYYQSALKIIEEKEDELGKRGGILEKLGDIKRIQGQYDDCIKYLNQALSLSEQLDEKEKTSRLHRKISTILWRALGENEKAKVHQERALEILLGEPESAELARLYEDMSRLAWHTGNMNKARSYAEKTLEVAEKMQALEVTADAYLNLAMLFDITGETKKSVQYIEKALKIALANSYTESALRAYNNLAALLMAEEAERSLELWEKGFELAKKVGNTTWISFMGKSVAFVYRAEGNIEQSLQLLEQSVALSRKTHNLMNLCASLEGLAWDYLILGELERSEQLFNETLEISKRLNHFQELGVTYGCLGYLYLYGKEEPTKAKEFYEKAWEIFDKAGAKSLTMRRAFGLCDGLIASCIEVGEIDKASNMLKDLEKHALEVSSRSLVSDAHILKGRLLRAQRRWKESIEYFDEGLREWEALNYKQLDVYNFARRGLREYARVYSERDQTGDRKKARDLLNQALEIFQKLGAEKDIEKTIKLIDGLQLAPQAQVGTKAVSPAGNVSGEVQVKVVASPRELKVGEPLELEIEIKNTRKEGTITLTTITGVIPEGFAIARKPEAYRAEGDCLDLKEKQLEPSKREEVKLVLTPKIQGTFEIKPKIVYVDEDSKEKTCEPRSIGITVKELGLKGWLKGER